MATVIEGIKTIDKKISNSLSDVSRENRGYISQVVLDATRDLVEHIYAREIFGAEHSYGWDEVQKVKKSIKNVPSLSFLSSLYNKLECALSHYAPEEHDSEVLLLMYAHTLLKIKIFYKSRYSEDILNNLKNYPLYLDEGLREYYEKALKELNTENNNETRKGYFYIDRVRSLIINGDILFEITFRPAVNAYEKFSKSIAFTKFDIPTGYAVQLSVQESKINVYQEDITISLIQDYSIAIRPCEIEYLGKVFDRSFQFDSRNTEYRKLMEYMKSKQVSLTEIACIDESSFLSIINYISKSENSKINWLLKELRTLITTNSRGVNTVKYLSSFIRNSHLKTQLSIDRNGVLSGLHLQYGCIVFDDMPYCSNLLEHRPSINVLLGVISIENRKHEFLARHIINNLENRNIIFTSKDELGSTYNIEKEIHEFNKKVYVKKEDHKKRLLEEYGEYVYQSGANNDCLQIMNEIRSLCGSGIQNYDLLINAWLEINTGLFDCSNKVEVVKGLFANSHAAFIYGSAGTGKTRMIKHATQIFEKEKKLLLSSTNSAVNNLKNRIKSDDQIEFKTIASYLANTDHESYDLVILDECSTIENSNLLKILRRKNFTKIIFVGDIYQIESINFGNWFFVSKGLMHESIIFELSNTHRTKNEVLIKYWNEIRNSDVKMGELSSRNYIGRDISDLIKEYEIEDDQVVLAMNYDGLYGVNNLNHLLQSKNPNTVIRWNMHKYKVGDPVIFNGSRLFSKILYNNLKGKITNIEVGKQNIRFSIHVPIQPNPFEAASSGITITETFDDGSCVVQFIVGTLEDVDEDSDYAEKTVPFHIAYATSIHKSQGLEYEKVKVVFIDEVKDRITHSIFYTAITRAKKELKIYWSPETGASVYQSLGDNLSIKDLGLFKAKNSL